MSANGTINFCEFDSDHKDLTHNIRGTSIYLFYAILLELKTTVRSVLSMLRGGAHRYTMICSKPTFSLLHYEPLVLTNIE